ncbi:alpha-D-ribose 1-methylphosphonate 5-triphosphate diphosphatase [Shimia sp. NS0008-38b]|uniref:alpha-D-ribose 1-methylphosphonate 5-triphosphate diphosphatase n=1 Tax=Shimia sp. NS0008-38b TaxID=3127653 RepID=UPI00310C6AEF
MWLSDVSIVLRNRVIACGSLRIENGLITEIAETGGTATHTVYPGFVDMHGDMIEHELEPRPGVDFPMDVAVNHLDARLAAAGVTTAYAGVSFSRTAKDGDRRSYQHTTDIIHALKSQQADLRVDHRIHARFDITFTAAIDSLENLLTAGSVDLVSVMDHTPGQGQYRNLEKLIAYRMRDGKVSEQEARAQIQTRIDASLPTEDIYTNLQTVSRLCKAHGIAVASHDDDTMEKANIMADIGAVISEFPVTMEAAEVAVKRGMMTAMGAPNAMRGQSYSGNLSARDAHAASLLHILAADYHPAAILPAIHALAETDSDGLPGAVRLATTNPAEVLGLTDRGEIALGKRADLAVVDTQNRVVTTFSEGQTVFSNGTVTPTANSPIAAV